MWRGIPLPEARGDGTPRWSLLAAREVQETLMRKECLAHTVVYKGAELSLHVCTEHLAQQQMSYQKQGIEGEGNH